MIMSGPQRVSGEVFAVERLREDPNLDYTTLRGQATAAGISMQPIHYGRARRQLGLPALRDTREEATTRTRFDPPSEAVDQPPFVPDEEAGNAPASPAPDPTPGRETKRKGSAAFEFLMQELRREPGLAYGELRDRATAKGFSVAPIMYGRAKAVLGLVPVKPRKSKQAQKAEQAAAAPLRMKQVESVAADRFTKHLDEVRNLEQLVAVVKELDAERRRLRSVLERVVLMIDEVLG